MTRQRNAVDDKILSQLYDLSAKLDLLSGRAQVSTLPPQNIVSALKALSEEKQKLESACSEGKEECARWEKELAAAQLRLHEAGKNEINAVVSSVEALQEAGEMHDKRVKELDDKIHLLRQESFDLHEIERKAKENKEVTREITRQKQTEKEKIKQQLIQAVEEEQRNKDDKNQIKDENDQLEKEIDEMQNNLLNVNNRVTELQALYQGQTKVNEILNLAQELEIKSINEQRRLKRQNLEAQTREEEVRIAKLQGREQIQRQLWIERGKWETERARLQSELNEIRRQNEQDKKMNENEEKKIKKEQNRIRRERGEEVDDDEEEQEDDLIDEKDEQYTKERQNEQEDIKRIKNDEIKQWKLWSENTNKQVRGSLAQVFTQIRDEHLELQEEDSEEEDQSEQQSEEKNKQVEKRKRIKKIELLGSLMNVMKDQIRTEAIKAGEQIQKELEKRNIEDDEDEEDTDEEESKNEHIVQKDEDESSESEDEEEKDNIKQKKSVEQEIVNNQQKEKDLDDEQPEQESQIEIDSKKKALEDQIKEDERKKQEKDNQERLQKEREAKEKEDKAKQSQDDGKKAVVKANLLKLLGGDSDEDEG